MCIVATVGIIRCTCNSDDLCLVYGNFKCCTFHFNNYVGLRIEILYKLMKLLLLEHNSALEKC